MRKKERKKERKKRKEKRKKDNPPKTLDIFD